MAIGGFTTSDYIWMPTSPLDTSAIYSLFCWFYDTTANATAKTLFGNVDAGNANSYSGMDVISGTVRFPANGFSGRVASSNTYSASTWNSAGAVRAGATSRAVWLNGTKTSIATSLTPSPYTVFAVGIRRQTSGSPTTPATSITMAEVAGWQDALTDAEFASLAAGASPRMIRPQSLRIYEPLVTNITDLISLPPTVVGSLSTAPHPRIYQ